MCRDAYQGRLIFFNAEYKNFSSANAKLDHKLHLMMEIWTVRVKIHDNFDRILL